MCEFIATVTLTSHNMRMSRMHLLVRCEKYVKTFLTTFHLSFNINRLLLILFVFFSLASPSWHKHFFSLAISLDFFLPLIMSPHHSLNNIFLSPLQGNISLDLIDAHPFFYFIFLSSSLNLILWSIFISFIDIACINWLCLVNLPSLSTIKCT